MKSPAGNGQEDDTGMAKEASNRVDEIGLAVQRDAKAFRASVERSASELMESVNARLRAVGVDPDVIGHMARDQAGEAQRYLEREIRHRPLRAVGAALALGAIVGFLTAR